MKEMYEAGAKPKLVVSVEDTGVGMTENDQKGLFKMFGTIQNTRQMNSHGIGLGLFICKKIVSEFNGQIKVKSQFGKGSTFAFFFEFEEKQ